MLYYNNYGVTYACHANLGMMLPHSSGLHIYVYTIAIYSLPELGVYTWRHIASYARGYVAIYIILHDETIDVVEASRSRVRLYSPYSYTSFPPRIYKYFIRANFYNAV